MNAPCYRCARRAINCHTACTDYAEYRKVCNQIQTAPKLNESLTLLIPSAATKSARMFAKTACTTRGKDGNDD